MPFPESEDRNNNSFYSILFWGRVFALILRWFFSLTCESSMFQVPVVQIPPMFACSALHSSPPAIMFVMSVSLTVPGEGIYILRKKYNKNKIGLCFLPLM